MMLVSLSYGQETCWCAFEVNSQNNEYVARIAPATNVPKPNWKSDWRIKVYKIANGSRELLWESKYTYAGKPKGLLSNDGAYFTYVENWYYKDLPLLTLYKNGRKVSSVINGKSLSIARGKLKKMRLHYVWLSQFELPYQYNVMENGQTYLVLKTIDKKTVTVHLDSGTLVGKS